LFLLQGIRQFRILPFGIDPEALMDALNYLRNQFTIFFERILRRQKSSHAIVTDLHPSESVLQILKLINSSVHPNFGDQNAIENE
jgi:hypothetical protein